MVFKGGFVTQKYQYMVNAQREARINEINFSFDIGDPLKTRHTFLLL